MLKFFNFSKADTFLNVFKAFEDQEDNDAKDDKTITAVGILSTVDSILSVMEGKVEVRYEFSFLRSKNLF